MISFQSPFAGLGQRSAKSLKARLKAIGYAYANKPSETTPQEPIAEKPKPFDVHAGLVEPQIPEHEPLSDEPLDAPSVPPPNPVEPSKGSETARALLSKFRDRAAQRSKETTDDIKTPNVARMLPKKEDKPTLDVIHPNEPESDPDLPKSTTGEWRADEKEIKGMGKDPKTGKPFFWKKRYGYIYIPTPLGEYQFIASHSKKRGWSFSLYPPLTEADKKKEERAIAMGQQLELDPDKVDRRKYKRDLEEAERKLQADAARLRRLGRGKEADKLEARGPKVNVRERPTKGPGTRFLNPKDVLEKMMQILQFDKGKAEKVFEALTLQPYKVVQGEFDISPQVTAAKDEAAARKQTAADAAKARADAEAAKKKVVIDPEELNQ